MTPDPAAQPQMIIEQAIPGPVCAGIDQAATAPWPRSLDGRQQSRIGNPTAAHRAGCIHLSLPATPAALAQALPTLRPAPRTVQRRSAQPGAQKGQNKRHTEAGGRPGMYAGGYGDDLPLGVGRVAIPTRSAASSSRYLADGT